eukprot:TRINITY_DN16150_c0_g1_i1.p1 TRINITY_DN16150_c0_g1~~TRINITY_DN16150_c0_g1_i1.p1  ORF type:complete len:1016 (+),score=184.22 TRINITY_DN16150_c0_g1_i1:88-3135(+)
MCIRDSINAEYGKKGGSAMSSATHIASLLCVALAAVTVEAETAAANSIVKDLLSPLGNGVNEVEWVGAGANKPDRTTILLTTHDGSLFRSSDNGNSWKAQDKKRLGTRGRSSRQLLAKTITSKSSKSSSDDDDSLADPDSSSDSTSSSKKTDVVIDDVESQEPDEQLCPSAKQKNKLACKEGTIECEDLYSICPDVRKSCFAMGCKLSSKNLLSPEEEDRVLKLDPHPSDKLAGTVFITGMKKNNWITSNGGETYTNVETSFILRGLKWHPYQKWALSYESNLECLYERTHRCFGNLMLSLDGGKKWKRIAWNIKYPNYGWLQTGTGSAWESRKDIVAIQHKKDRGPKQSWDTELNLIHSDDFFKNKNVKVMLPQGNNFAIIDKYIFVAVANSQKDVSLWVSTNNGANFGMVKMPADVAERSYGILHTAEQSCFVIVRAGEIRAKHGTLYQSDESGMSMALSLKNTHYERGRNADIVKTQGIEGVYIVNTVVESGNVVDIELDDEDDASSLAEPTQLATKITFDKGARWRSLAAPTKDSTGVNYPGCARGKCNLHLFFKGNPQKYSPIYSVSSATGIILATGTVGESYTEEMAVDEVGTFFSRDAGRTWTEIRKGSSIYEISDHGALIVVAPEGVKTRKVRYTWDEGITWETATLPSSMEVTSIRTDPKSSSLHFAVLGRTSVGVGVSVTLDFNTLHKRECRGESTADESGSDYELWSPRDPDGGSEGTCVLGRSVVYTRRKQAKKCHNGAKRDRKTFRRNCKCTKVDFECAAGFEPMEGGKICAAQRIEAQAADDEVEATANFQNDMLALYKDDLLLNDLCSKYSDKSEMFAPSGFRRVPGNTCAGGLDMGEKNFACPRNYMSMHGFAVLVVLFILAVVMACATVLSRHERFQFFLKNMGAGELPYVKYIFLGEDSSSRPESVFDEDFALVDGEEDDEAQVLPDVNESYDKHYERKSKSNPYDNPYAGGSGMSFTAKNAGVNPVSHDPHDPFNPMVAPVTDEEINACLEDDKLF